jgi:hypothetical protein
VATCVSWQTSPWSGKEEVRNADGIEELGAEFCTSQVDGGTLGGIGG